MSDQFPLLKEKKTLTDEHGMIDTVRVRHQFRSSIDYLDIV